MSSKNDNNGQRTTAAPSLPLSERFSQFAHATSVWTGNPMAFLLAVAVVIVWVASGPFFNYSDTWQLVINTGTTIVTFLMVFLIQTEPGYFGYSAKTVRACARDEGGGEQICGDRGSH